MSIEVSKLIDAIHSNRIRITDHADEEAFADRLKLTEIMRSVLNGEIIEEYPKDKPYPSCLVFGKNENGEPIHSVWAYDEDRKWSVLVTVYKPDPDLWIKYRKRKKKE